MTSLEPSTKSNGATNMDVAVQDTLPLHGEAACELRVPASTDFEHIDQPERLSAHMARPSWQLAGASMTIETDGGGGRRVGSHVRLADRMLEILLRVEGVVVEREPPKLKTWETIGQPRLMVIGRYHTSVRMDAWNDRSHVTISIDYALPAGAPVRWLGKAFGSLYANWRVRQMVRDLVHRFRATRNQSHGSIFNWSRQ
jgi:hypothetical protein